MIEIKEGDIPLMCGPFPNVEGAEMIDAACGHQVGISPASKELIKEHGNRVVPICMSCFLEHPGLRESLAQRGASITPEQRVEINKYLGVAATDQMMSRFRIKEREI